MYNNSNLPKLKLHFRRPLLFGLFEQAREITVFGCYNNREVMTQFCDRKGSVLEEVTYNNVEIPGKYHRMSIDTYIKEMQLAGWKFEGL